MEIHFIYSVCLCVFLCVGVSVTIYGHSPGLPPRNGCRLGGGGGPASRCGRACDVPWVAQSLEAYTSKLFALSYSIATIAVSSGNPADHLVHRHTHRVVRGALLAVGRPDGRLNALSAAENTVCLSVNQASSIQNFGVTCESITVGHNPSRMPLTAKNLFLPRQRPLFFSEHIVEAFGISEAEKKEKAEAPNSRRKSILGKSRAKQASSMSAGALMGKLAGINIADADEDECVMPAGKA